MSNCFVKRFFITFHSRDLCFLLCRSSLIYIHVCVCVWYAFLFAVLKHPFHIYSREQHFFLLLSFLLPHFFHILLMCRNDWNVLSLALRVYLYVSSSTCLNLCDSKIWCGNIGSVAHTCRKIKIYMSMGAPSHSSSLNINLKCKTKWMN